MVKKLLILLITLMLAVSAVGCGTAPSSESTQTTTAMRDYTDMDGTVVKIPAKVNTVVDLWAANNQVLVLLGVSDRVVGTTSGAQKTEWMLKINPRIADLPSLITGDDINKEELLKVKPDLIIMNDRGVESVRATGIPAVNLKFSDYDGLKTMILKTAELFGDEQIAIAKKFNTYFDGNVKRVSDVVATIPESERKTIYYARNDTNILTTDGAKTMADEWINLIGCRNASAASIEGFGKTISIETIAAENPDIIILMDINDPAALKDSLFTDPQWSQMKAVENRQVYVNPAGVFYWERYSAEEAMQVLWIAKTVYPEKFKDLDMVKETKDFYKNFFYYDLTDAEANDILNTAMNSNN